MEDHLPADDLLILSKLPTTKAVADDNDRRSSGIRLLLGVKQTSTRGGKTQHREAVARYCQALDLLDVLAGVERHDLVGECSQAREDVGLIAKGLIDRVVEDSLCPRLPIRGTPEVVDAYQITGLVHRKRTQTELIQGTEDRCVRADGDSGDQDDRNGETGRLRQHPKAIFDVVPERRHCTTPLCVIRYELWATSYAFQTHIGQLMAHSPLRVSLAAKGLHRIDPRRAPGREQAGHGGGRQEEQTHRDVCQGIMR